MGASTADPLPSGVVTFVLSDIEGSTRLFHRLGSVYVSLLAEHQALLRDAVERHRGVEVETEGDALLAAFADAAEAVAACLDGQRALTAHAWPAGSEVLVRMGLHTGEATPIGGSYVALPVPQVSRICAAAHGGQVLLSQATANAVATRLPRGASLAALGSFQLRGFPAAERLFQLRHADLRDAFPPLRAPGVVAHNLPFQRQSFVGRADERSALAALLSTTGVVTVVGPAGVGKTRLAVQVAFDVMDRYADGAWIVELGGLDDPGLVPRAVADAVRVAEEAGRGLEDVLMEALAPKSLLLLLDNCEHLVDAVARLAERLAQHCPNVAMLATSREPLQIDGEVVWRLDPLPTVDPGRVGGMAAVATSDAARLFAERAALVKPGFRLTGENVLDVARLVFHLDGIPLAIELAAAALLDRPLSAVLQGLRDRFVLLTSGRRTAPGRHQTLRAALEWSLDLLDAEERLLFARLAAFARTGTIEAASDVCAGGPVRETAVPPALRRLIRASLIVASPAAERWSMLESVAELAAIELREAGEADDVAARHRGWYVRRVEAVQGDIGRTDRGDVMRELTADHDNIRRAVDTAVAAADFPVALRLCTAMAPFWTSAGYWTEGTERLRAVVALPGGDDRLRGRALVATGNLLLLRGDLAEAEAHFAEAAERASTATDDVTLAKALSGTGYIAFRRSRLDDAEHLWQEALDRAQTAGDERVAAGILRSLAIAAGSHQDQDRAGQLLEQAITCARRVGDDLLLRQLLGSAAEMHLWLGHYERAADEYGDALELATGIGDLSARPLLLAELGWVGLLRGDVPIAQRLAVEAAELAQDLGNRRVLSHALRLHGEALLRRGRVSEAGAALDRALTVARELGAPAEVAGVLCSQAASAVEQVQPDDATRLAEEALALSALPHPMRLVPLQWVLGAAALADRRLDRAEREFRSIGEQGPSVRHAAGAMWGLACVSAARGDTHRAAACHGRALTMRQGIGDRLGVAESLVGLAAAAANVEPEEAARLVGAATTSLAAAGAVATPRQEAAATAALTAATNAGDPRRVAAARDEGAALDQDAAVATAIRLADRVTTPPSPAGGRTV